MASFNRRRAAKGLGERKRELCDYHWLVPHRSEVSCTHTGFRQQRYTGEEAGNWKDIWGRANLHMRLLQSLCAWGGLSLGWDGSQGGSKCRSPWRPEDHAEITLSTYCQVAVRSWTFVRRWSTRDRQDEEGGCFQDRVRDAVSTAHTQQGAVFISTSYLFCFPTWKTVSLQWASHRRKVKILKLTEVNLLCYLNYSKSQHPFTVTHCLMCYYFPFGLIIRRRQAD